MRIRAGASFLESLRDGRQMWIDGELVHDVTRDRGFALDHHGDPNGRLHRVYPEASALNSLGR